MLDYIKRKVGLQLLLAFTAVLFISILLVITISSMYSSEFGELILSENEEYITSQALKYLSFITEQKAQSHEATFKKLTAYSNIISKQAEFLFETTENSASYSANVSDYLKPHLANNILYNARTEPLSILYWGEPKTSQWIGKEIDIMSSLAPILSESKEKNPEVTASHLILTSGAGAYYPNNGASYLLPRVSELDLRNTNNYILASPENNPTKRSVWVPVYFDDVGHGLITTISSPIYSQAGNFLGVSGLDIQLSAIQSLILAPIKGDNNPEQKDLISFLVDDRGKIISFPVELLSSFGIESDSANFKNSLDLLNKGLEDSSFEDIRSLSSKIFETDKQTFRWEINRKPYFVSSSILPTNRWRLISIIPEETFLAPINSIEKKLVAKLEDLEIQLYAIGLFFFFGSIIMTKIFLNNIVIRPLQKVTSTAEQIRDGDLHSELDLKRIDEIGSLVHSFNVMLKSIRQSRDFERSYTHELESEVKNQTREINKQKLQLEKTLAKLEEDIKERMIIEQELISAKENADAANQAKSEFLANMTHELRTPLIGVLGMNELLLKTSLNDKQKSLGETVHESGQSLLALINDMLDFSKIESGKLVLENTVFDISTLVESCTNFFTQKAEDKGLKLSCHVYPESRRIVNADPLRLRQIITNLISNAVKFTSKGGVTIKLSLDQMSPQVGNFTIDVIDTGIGISEENQEMIFSFFLKVDSTTVRAF